MNVNRPLRGWLTTLASTLESDVASYHVDPAARITAIGAAITEARTKLSVVDENGNDTTHRATAAAQEALDAFAGAVDAKLVAGPPPATLGANVEEKAARLLPAMRTIPATVADEQLVRLR